VSLKTGQFSSVAGSLACSKRVSFLDRVLICRCWSAVSFAETASQLKLMLGLAHIFHDIAQAGCWLSKASLVEQLPAVALATHRLLWPDVWPGLSQYPHSWQWLLLHNAECLQKSGAHSRF